MTGEREGGSLRHQAGRESAVKRFGAGGQAGLQCSATITDRFYERTCLLGAVRASCCLRVRRRLCCGLNVNPDVEMYSVQRIPRALTLLNICVVAV